MLKKKSFLSLFFLSALMCCILAVFVGCDNTVKYAVTWEVNENAKVEVEGYETLPSEVEEGTTLTFKATGENGYQIEKVVYEVNGKDKVAPAKGGKYSIPVTADTTIKVTVEPEIESVTVTTNPTTMTYYTGDVLNADGMVVTVSYKTGASEAVTNYTVNYANAEAGAFSRGDTGFTVTYQGMTSAEVKFAAAVETKVTLDLAGGMVDEATVAAFAATEGINNFTVTEDGKATFTFANLENEVELPTNVTFMGEEAWPFGNWQIKNPENPLAAGKVVTAISNTTVPTSGTITAVYQVQLIEVTGVDLAYDNKTPILEINVKFVNDGTVYPYLYEGNAKVELKGEEVTGKKGESKTITVDLTTLASAVDKDGNDFTGKWMDIRVNADVAGVVYTTNVSINPEAALAEVGSTVHDDTNLYRLHYYLEGSRLDLKVYFVAYKYTYTVSTAEVEGVPTLVIEGTLNADAATYAGGTVSISWGATALEGTIADDATWKITAPLADCQTSLAIANGITFTKGENSIADGKMHLAGLQNKLSYNPTYSGHQCYSTTMTCGIYEVTVGCDWNEPWIVVEDTSVKITADKFELVAESDKPYAVFTGTYGSAYTTVEQLTEALALKADASNGFGGFFQQYNTWSYLDLTDKVTVTMNNGTYTLKVDISGMTIQDGYYIHFGGNNFTAKEWTEGQTITAGGYSYTLGLGTLSWATSLMTIWVKDAAGPQIEKTTVSLMEKGGVAYFVINGTWNAAGCDKATAEAALKAIGVNAEDPTAQSNDLALQQYNNGWGYIYPAPEYTLNNDGTFTVAFSLAEATADGAAYPWYCHFAGDVKLPVSGETTLTIGTKTYTLSQGWDGAPDWAAKLTVVTITDSAAA